MPCLPLLRHSVQTAAVRRAGGSSLNRSKPARVRHGARERIGFRSAFLMSHSLQTAAARRSGRSFTAG
ncbi:hypothetical protein [Paenibacillus sp. 1P03SA]|uniref:hypothetical protein n=1 Tax=Paenibacillus sp. 1P03SA TaxID=3132294 RepID=UPI0039A24A0E